MMNQNRGLSDSLSFRKLSDDHVDPWAPIQSIRKTPVKSPLAKQQTVTRSSGPNQLK